MSQPDAIMTTPPRPRLSGQIRLAAAVFIILALLPILLSFSGQSFFISVICRMMIYAIAALSLDLILGYGGMVSFGHAAFLGIGAYTVLILNGMGVTDLAIQTIAALVVSALFAVVTGAISLRTRGIYFIMITLAFGQMAFFFFISLAALGGDDGKALSRRSTIFGQSWLQNETSLFYLVLALLIIVFVILSRLTRSRFGRVLVGSRENELRMEAMGYEVFPFRLIAYVISAAICGLAGVLLANQTLYVSPGIMSWVRSGEMIIMLVVGGIGSLSGALVGALVTVGLEELLARFSEHWKLVFGILLLLLVLYAPKGLGSLFERVGLRETKK